MIRRILNIVNRLSLTDSLIRVNKLFLVSNKNSNLMRLENNYVFQHACMTPLTVLSCSLDSLEQELRVKKQISLENIKNAKKAVARLTNIIVSITKTNKKTKDFEVHQSIDEIVFLFKSKYHCVVHYSNFLPKKQRLNGNKLYFQEILICLLNNAYEAYQDKKLAHLSICVRIIKGQVFIGVVDFAKGMTHLGQKLAMLKGVSYKENGLGLGLAFVKKTLENEFDGVLKIVSEYGVGTHAQISIPILKPYIQNPLQS